MTDFYNRYRNLFTLTNNPPTAHQYKTITENKPIITQPIPFPSHPFFSVPQYERKPSNYLNVARSPAMDEFQKQVLPKFARPYPQQPYLRLKTQMDQNTHKMNSKISRNLSLGHEFYQLPKVYNTKVQDPPIRQRIMTEPNESLPKGRNHNYDKRDMVRQIQELQKQYLGRAHPNQEDRVFDKNEIESNKLQNSRQRVMTYNEPIQGLSRLQKVKYGNSIKKWEVKVLPTIESRSKHDTSLISPRQPDQNAQFKLYESRQKELFGVRQNQYAFVNDKLGDIKKAQKYYPRGYINSYRQALFRRKNAKNDLKQRRIKLKMQLYQQEEKYARF